MNSLMPKPPYTHGDMSIKALIVATILLFAVHVALIGLMVMLFCRFMHDSYGLLLPIGFEPACWIGVALTFLVK